MMWENVPESISEFTGFVYIIINKVNQKYYIGQKKYWFKKKLKPLKGKKQNRHKVVESDWKTYYGSSIDLQNDVKQYTQKNFNRKILLNCKTKAWMNYFEAKLQFDYNVLYDSNSYNGIINCRIGKNQLNFKKL